MIKKQFINTLKRNLIKKTAVISLAGILLCSQSLTAAAAASNATATSQDHEKCEYYITNATSTSLVPSHGSHKYLQGTKNYPDGRKEDVYADCITYTTSWTGTWTCAICGKTAGPANWIEITHSFCGKSKETIFN